MLAAKAAREYFLGEREAVDPLLCQKECCKRAFLRQAFLTAGTVITPEKSYDLEILCELEEQADLVVRLFASFGVTARSTYRKNRYVVYVKEGEAVAEALSIIGANRARLHMENERILKEMRNSINRKVNCEAANINKTISAAQRQLDDIATLEEMMGLEKLGDELCELALLRREHTEASLEELGQMLATPIGKSGVNHRMRKLHTLAEKARETNGTRQ